MHPSCSSNETYSSSKTPRLKINLTCVFLSLASETPPPPPPRNFQDQLQEEQSRRLELEQRLIEWSDSCRDKEQEVRRLGQTIAQLQQTLMAEQERTRNAEATVRRELEQRRGPEPQPALVRELRERNAALTAEVDRLKGSMALVGEALRAEQGARKDLETRVKMEEEERGRVRAWARGKAAAECSHACASSAV